MEALIPALPTRPTRSNNIKNFSTVSLHTNHYGISIKNKSKIFLYHITIEPEVPAEHRRKIARLINNSKKPLEKFIGTFIHSGMILFGSKDNSETMTVQTSQYSPENEEYIVSLKRVKETAIEILATFNPNMQRKINDVPVFQFLNILIKECMQKMGMVSIGKDNRYYDLSRETFLEEYPIKVWSGFYTACSMYKGGPKMLIDFNTKVLNSQSVLEHIYILKENGMGKQAIERELVDHIVVANYGNNRTYKIEGINFEKNPRSFSGVMNDQHQEITFEDYMRTRYGIRINDPAQPLIKTSDRRNKEQILYLIPELFNMTGISDEMKSDYSVMKSLARYTKLEPQDRMNKIQNQFTDLKKENNKLPFEIDLEQPQQVSGFQIPPPKAIFSRSKMTIDPQKPNFFIKDDLYDVAHLDDWVIVGNFKFKNDNQYVDIFLDKLRFLAKKVGMRVQNPTIKLLSSPKFAGLKADLEKVITKTTQMVVTIIPKQLKTGPFYSDFKQYLLKEKGVLSQFVVSDSLSDEKKVGAIMLKLLIQISAKCGKAPWLTQLPSNMPKNTMLIGADVYHKLVSNRNSLLGFCATLDSDFSSYFQDVAKKPAGKEMMEEISQLVQKALIAYRNNSKTKSYPENIIFYRDGVGESQVDMVRDIELKSILGVIDNMYSQANTPIPKYAHIIVTKRINDRFFPKVGNQFRNPVSGMIVADDVVSNNFDFFMAAQNVTQGTCTPTHYNVIYNTFEVPEDFFWELTYFQTFNYYNWTGPIKVPAPVMYAHKLSFLIGDTFQANAHPNLQNKLYYL